MEEAGGPCSALRCAFDAFPSVLTSLLRSVGVRFTEGCVLDFCEAAPSCTRTFNL